MSNTTSDVPVQGDASSPLPSGIVQTLRRVIRRVRIVTLTRGLLAVAAACAAATLAAMAVDASVTLFSAWPRWVLSLSAMAVVLVVAWQFLIRPMRRTFTLAGIAGAIESHHPEMHERISSAVELLSSSDSPELRGSDLLISALAREAVMDASAMRVKSEVTLRSLRPLAIALGVLAAVFAAVFIAWPQQASFVWYRVIAPQQDRPNVHAYQLVIQPGDAVVAAGDSLPVEVQVADPRVGSASLHRQAGGDQTVSEMSSLPPQSGNWPRFGLTCPPAGEDYQYRIHAGDALSGWYHVTVVPRPAVETMQVSCEYPAYTHNPPAVMGSDIRALAGSTITVTARVNTAVDAASLLVNETVVSPAVIAADANGATTCTFRFPVPHKTQGTWWIHLTRTVGKFECSSTTDPHNIDVAADAPPMARIINPGTTSLKLKNDEKLPVGCVLGDDFGLSKAELVVSIDGHRQAPIPLTLPEAKDGRQPRAAACTTVLDLGELDARRAGLITFHVRALDNLPPELGGPQEGLSQEISIHPDMTAVSYIQQVVMSEELVLHDALEKALAELKESQTDSKELRKVLCELAAHDANAPVAAIGEVNLQRIERIVKHLGLAEHAIRDPLPQLQTSAYQPLCQQLTSLADDHIAKAGNLCGQIKISEELKARGDLADETDFQIDRSIGIITDLLKNLYPMAVAAARGAELADLSDQQQQLSKALPALLAAQTPAEDLPMDAASQPADLAQAPTPNAPDTQPAENPSDEMGTPLSQVLSPQQWQKSEADVAQRLGQLVHQSPQGMQKQMTRAAADAKDLVAEARKIAAGQTELADATRRLAPVEDVSKALQGLATEQAALAQRAAAEKDVEPAATKMKDAAADLKDARTADAIRNQSDAAAELTAKADALKARRTAYDLARQAQALADQEKAVAQQVQAARQAKEQAQGAADAAAQQGAAAKQENQQDQSRVQKDLADLHAKQVDLAGQSAKLEQAIAGNSVFAAAKNVKPSGAMSEAAGAMTPDKAAQARQSLAKAVQQAAELARQAAAEKIQSVIDKLKAALQQALAAAVKAHKDAEAARLAADNAKQNAQAAADKQLAAAKAAQDALAKAAAAQAQADQAKDANAADAAAQLAAAQKAKAASDAAAAAAAQAQKLAEAAKTNAAVLDNTAKMDANAADAADRQVAELQKQQADAATLRQAAEKLADQAATLADAEKKLQDQFEKVAGADLKQLTDSQAQMARLQDEQARDKKSAEQAALQLAALLKPQQDLLQQAQRLNEEANQVPAEAAKALAEHNVPEAMKQAQAAIQAALPADADKKTAQAAKEAAELAKALLAADANSGPPEQADVAAMQLSQLLGQSDQAANQAQALEQRYAQAEQVADQAVANKDPNAAEKVEAAGQAQKDADQASEHATQEAKDVAQAAENATAAFAGAPPNIAQMAQAAAAAARTDAQAQQQLADTRAAAEAAAKELQQAQSKAAQEPKNPAAAKELQQAQAAAAKALRNEQQSQAAANAAQGRLDAAVQTAKANADSLAANDAAQATAGAGRLGELAKAQGDLKKRTADLLLQKQQLVDAVKADQVNQLKTEEEALARQTADLGNRVGDLAPREDRMDRQAAKAASDAAQEIASKQLDAAAASAAKAGEELGDLARRMGADVPPPSAATEPAAGGTAPDAAGPNAVAVQGSTSQLPHQVANELGQNKDTAKRLSLGKEAADLAARQQAVADQLSALAQNRVTDALGARQEKLSEATKTLADDVGLMHAYADDLAMDPQARQEADNAMASLNAAASAQKAAQASLQSAAPRAAEAKQRAAAASVDGAAAALDRLGQKMAEVARAAPKEPNDELSGLLPPAFETVEDALRTHAASDTDQAASMLKQLSQAADQQAQAMGVSAAAARAGMLSSQPPMGLQSAAARGAGPMQVEGMSGELSGMGLTGWQWGLLPGELRDEILQAASDEGPEEYRALIKRYFAEVAKRGAAAEEAKKK